MTEFKVGDRVKYTGRAYLPTPEAGIGTVKRSEPCGARVKWDDGGKSTEETHDLQLIGSGVNPNHYVFPGGVEVRQISAHLTSFGGQAVQYVARATRLDGQNKGEAVEDLKKAIKFLTWEIERIEDSE